jgi:hypothetical protein
MICNLETLKEQQLCVIGSLARGLILGDKQMIRTGLLAHENPNKLAFGCHPLLLAAHNHDHDTLDHLLVAGGNINYHDEDGKSMADFLLAVGDEEGAALLVAHSAEVHAKDFVYQEHIAEIDFTKGGCYGVENDDARAPITWLDYV